eukprot:g81706.t1
MEEREWFEEVENGGEGDMLLENGSKEEEVDTTTASPGTSSINIVNGTTTSPNGSTGTLKPRGGRQSCCPNWPQWLAETLANFFLVLLTLAGLFISAVLESDALRMDRLLYIAFVYGMSYASLVYSFSTSYNIRHLNPAVTLALTVSGKIGISRAMLHWFAQLVGSVLAALVLPAVVPFKSWSHEPFEKLESVTLEQEFLASISCSLVSVLVIIVTFWGQTRDQRTVAPVTGDKSEQIPWTVHELNSVLSGAVLVGCAVMAGAVSGSFMHPGFAIIFSIYTKRFDPAGIFGPVVGALVAAMILSGFTFTSRRLRALRVGDGKSSSRGRSQRHRSRRQRQART